MSRAPKIESFVYTEDFTISGESSLIIAKKEFRITGCLVVGDDLYYERFFISFLKLQQKIKKEGLKMSDEVEEF